MSYYHKRIQQEVGRSYVLGVLPYVRATPQQLQAFILIVIQRELNFLAIKRV